MRKKTLARPVISTPEAAENFGVHPRTIRRYIESGLIKNCQKFGRYYRIPIEEWEAFKARNLKDVA